MSKGAIYDVAVIGAGAAGTMAAIRAGELGRKALLIERNNSIGKKILLTGKGRCNITNSASIDTFIEKFQEQGEFFRTAFHKFFNQDLIDFFQAKGLELKEERQGRVFPATDKAESVLEVFNKCLVDNKIDTLFNTRLVGINIEDAGFKLALDNNNSIHAKKAILATGGISYKATGSTGDGFLIAKKLGHEITPLKPALVPLKVSQPWIKQLQGLSLRNIRISFECAKKKKASAIGELMFTHFGISGPLVLDLSGEIVNLLEKHKKIDLFIDFKPALKREQLETRLLKEFKARGNMQLKSIMKGLLPQRMIQVFICLLNLNPMVKLNQITQGQRRSIINLLKALPLTVTGALPIEEAMVTNGGVSTKQINPRTMESRLVSGLYFVGEIIDGCAPSGGYNLQQAFSTGYLAGEEAARQVNQLKDKG
ncbi:MAG: NAD(P)/FAD-dependent oxidoreductase [Candidatus Omnitrophota bacterium]